LPIKGINTNRILELTERNDVQILNHDEIINYINKEKKKFELIVTLGAGDIDKLIPKIKKILTN